MDLGAFLSLAMGASFCVGGAVLCIGRWSRVRHLQDTPTSRIRSAAQGYTELVGVLGAASESPLFAPLTGERCLWWRYCIEEYRASGKRSSWAVIERGESEGWLRLTDATGECLIDPRGAEVLPAWRRRWTGDRRHPRGGAPGGLLQLLGMGSRYRYTEERLHAGEPLYAIGEFRSAGGGRQAMNLDALRAEVIQRQASQEPLLHRLGKPGDGLPFVLSSHGEDVIARRFYLQAAGGLLLCLAGAVWLAVHLGSVY